MVLKCEISMNLHALLYPPRVRYKRGQAYLHTVNYKGCIKASNLYCNLHPASLSE
jgi:hypothetical protein